MHYGKRSVCACFYIVTFFFFNQKGVYCTKARGHIQNRNVYRQTIEIALTFVQIKGILIQAQYHS